MSGEDVRPRVLISEEYESDTGVRRLGVMLKTGHIVQTLKLSTIRSLCAELQRAAARLEAEEAKNAPQGEWR